ncbi:TPA: hypothetical protein ACUI22_002820 [Staphylococcus aureus]
MEVSNKIMMFLSNLTMYLSLIGFVIVILCIVALFILKHAYNNGYIRLYQWEFWKKKLLFLMVLFVIFTMLLFMAHRHFENKVIGYDRNIEEQLE